MAATDPDPRPRPLRADARRNRQALLAAAGELFALEGSEASLDDIARKAGVGIGTLYRHFPTRQSLLEGVFLARAVELRQQADDLLAGCCGDTALSALVTWLRSQMRMGREGRSLGSAVLAAKHEEGSEINRACTEMFDSGTALLKRAQEVGAVSPDVEVPDVLRIVHGIILVTQGQPDAEAQADRMLDLVVGGLATGSAKGA